MKRIALITHERSPIGGLATLTTFLHRTLSESGRYQPELISLATSADDSASLRLKSPRSWATGARLEEAGWQDLSIIHAGAWGAELEFQRYRPRHSLRDLFAQFDLLQFIVGSPPWVCSALPNRRPIFLWTATTTRADRLTRMRSLSPARRAWAGAMVSLAERYEHRALRAADQIFALSEYTRCSIESISGREDVILAPCGVDTDLFHPANERTADKGDFILCVARFSDPRKNVRLLLEAYAMLVERMEAVPDLYLIGDPDEESIRSQLVSIGLGARVKLIAPRPIEELAELYRHARCVVLSSNEEGLGIVIIEAMASGIPVVSTACGGPATAITDGETGFLVPIGDRSALADAMERVLVDPDLRIRMGARGREVALERFSFAAAGKVFLDRYDAALQVERGEEEVATSSAGVTDSRAVSVSS